MASLSVRNLDEELLSRLKRRAARHGHSAEAEVRDIQRAALSSETEISFDDLAAELRALTAKRQHTPAETLTCDLSPKSPPLSSRARCFRHAHRDGVSRFG